MAFGALDDDFHSHPKILAAGLAATGLYARCLSYCARYLTDGHVPEPWARAAAGDNAQELIDTLTHVRLWQPEPGGFHIPSYLDYNPSREEALKRREERARSGRKGAASRWGAADRHSKSHSKSQGKSHSGSQSSSDSSSHSKSHGKSIARTHAHARGPFPDPLKEGEGAEGVQGEAAAQQAAPPPEPGRWNGRALTEEGAKPDRTGVTGPGLKQTYSPARGDAYVRNALIHVPASARATDLRYQFPDIPDDEAYRLLDAAADLTPDPEPEEAPA